MFCIVAIFKNESEILEEWITHYLREGCSHFFLIDNDSTDKYIHIINKYINKITLIKDSTKFSQAILYNKYFLKSIRRFEWCLVCDLDEFVYSRDKYETIAEYLNDLNSNISSIVIPWKMFGSNGYNILEKKEPKSVIESFTKRTDYSIDKISQGMIKTSNNKREILSKCIARTSKIIELKIHSSSIYEGLTIQSEGSIRPRIKFKWLEFAPINEEVLKSSQLHLNHYAIRSLDWFTRIKMTRGAADCALGERKKSRIQYFYKYDEVSNDIDDFELLNKRNKNINIPLNLETEKNLKKINMKSKFVLSILEYLIRIKGLTERAFNSF